MEPEEFNSDIAARFGDAEEQAVDFLNIQLFDGPALGKMLILFGINLLVCWIITHFFYYRKSHKREYYFTYMLFSTAIFFILYQLQNMSVEVGVALGLFGIFSMIRYRTEQLPIREMTYLFVLIAISIINGAGMASSYASFIATNIIFILLVWVLEAAGMSNRKAQKIITYEKIALIKPDRREELLADLRERTGLEIVKVQVGSINFLKDTAFLKVTYLPDDSEPNDIDMVTKFRGE
ncbi:MAG: DUF4956 domain-containing protein [Bacteroidales bacterium]|nr:DUF4956 domain-containing protein [Bacteroidales bacterium]